MTLEKRPALVVHKEGRIDLDGQNRKVVVFPDAQPTQLSRSLERRLQVGATVLVIFMLLNGRLQAIESLCRVIG